jgi:hypothetical protein
VARRRGPLAVSRRSALVVINTVIPIAIIILVFEIIHGGNVNVKIKIVKVGVRLGAFGALVVTKYNRIAYSAISREFKE